MSKVRRIEQQVVEQIRQHDAILGCLSSVELLMRSQVQGMNHSKKTVQEIPPHEDGHKSIKVAMTELVEKNNSLIRQIYEKIDSLRVSVFNLSNINRYV